MMTGDFGSKVVSLTGYQRAMRFSAIQEIQAYWDALRQGRPVPLRSEVDPRGIERALEHAFILERIAPQIARFRLAGMHLNDLMGMEVRGMPLTALFTPPARAALAEEIEAVFRTPAVLELGLSGETGMGKPPIEARLVVLPLRSDLGDISRALGGLVAEGVIGRTPRRFEVVSVLRRPIEAGLPLSAARPAPLSGIATPGLAEPRQPWAGALSASGPRARGHLRLVKTDD